ncbi:DUF427 domain-containing protein [Nocardia pseudobrasiliensis]|uniref:Uncharacterized protein (DUF427 family) n=1 Tax=Nocardia pseudobrasiliensis TaxID=45979 RepID=A0A370I691_9NOCA|nr:DUF427 domain-containing protein [Nocardia pseudobrasiliensis]RDI66160.1 uncharacterized protein (DUF427 family) [Nocardia pseudobrasiliensis]
MTETNRGRVRIEPSPKRVRTYVEGHLVADSTTPLLVWESPYYPTYYLPVADLHAKLEPSGSTRHSPSRGEGVQYDVLVDGVTKSAAALRYPDSPIPELRDLVRLDWNLMDEWFEEDEPVYVHPRNPYTRVDVLTSSRHVRVAIAGQTVAESHAPHILFETGLPPRYYLPMTDVRMDLLTPSPTRTSCPYKGTAEYFTIRIGDADYPDLVWLYRTPLPESQKVAGLVCFYNEKVDLFIDGVLQDRPKSPFS